MKSSSTAGLALILLGACASTAPDHFYVLRALPQGAGGPRSTAAVQARLKMSFPSSVDRPEMLLNTSADTVIVLEHERWAAPLAELATQALARDIEQRRTDMLVAAHEVGGSRAAAVQITVDVVQMTVRRGERASIEAHWRILDPRTGKDVAGGDEFSAVLGHDGYAAVAQALSECLGQLADRLVEQMR